MPVNRGVTAPYSPRGSQTSRAVTRPPTQRTRRRIEWREWTAAGRSGSNRATGMQSVTSRAPVSVSKRVTSTFVAGR